MYESVCYTGLPENTGWNVVFCQPSSSFQGNTRAWETQRTILNLLQALVGDRLFLDQFLADEGHKFFQLRFDLSYLKQGRPDNLAAALDVSRADGVGRIAHEFAREIRDAEQVAARRDDQCESGRRGSLVASG